MLVKRGGVVAGKEQLVIVEGERMKSRGVLVFNG